MVILLVQSVPVALADSGMVSASPSLAPPNTTISMISNATLSGATPKGYYDVLSYISVLTPSGTIYTCISGSAECNLVGFTATGPGTYQCAIPFGGAAASLSVSTTGGVSPYGGDCTGSDSALFGAWTYQTTSSTCPTVGNVCTGPSGLADLETLCTSGGWFGGTGSASTGDTSEAGTYQVLDCWTFYTSSPSSGPSGKAVVSMGSFTISPASEVPQFPFGLLALFAIAVPALFLLRSRAGVVRARNLSERALG